MDPQWFEKVLYPFQDEVLALVARTDTGFYLTGGTALGRIHLRHRYSEDLELSVNDDDRFVRALVSKGELPLKVELVNDVRGRVGAPARHEGFGLVDTKENILANRSPRSSIARSQRIWPTSGGSAGGAACC